jgi:hypothetical protein
MGNLIFGTSWGLVMLISLAGWGWALLRILGGRSASDPGIFLPLGLSWSIAVGGVLDWAGAVCPRNDVAFLTIGILLAGIALWSLRGAASLRWRAVRDAFATIGWLGKTVIVLLLALSCLAYAGSVYAVTFNPHDDLHGYFVFPLKMLQTGSLGPDPFSERRLVSSLGGQSFLHTFVLSALPIESLHLIDSGLCFLMMLAMVAGASEDRRPRGTRLLMMIAILVFTVIPHANISATMSGVVVFFGAFRWLDTMESRLRSADGLVLGMLLGGACVLKTSFVVPAVTMAGTFFLIRLASGRDPVMRRLGPALVTAAMASALAAPWMLSMFRSCGTLLYPLLGKGYHGSVYGSFATTYPSLLAPHAVRFTCIAASTALFISFFSLSALALTQKPRSAATVAMIAGGIVGTLAIGIATAGYGVDRYMFPFLFPAVLSLVCKIPAPAKAPEGAGSGHLPLAHLLVCVWLIGSQWEGSRQMFWQYGLNVRDALAGRGLASAQEAQRMRDAQNSVPEGDVILERVSKPFLLDFARNRVFIVDYPGGASPPPGMPFQRGPEALSSYLMERSIRYVMYSYRDEAQFSHAQYVERLGPHGHPWIRSEAEHTFDFQDSLSLLGSSRRRRYDDGDLFLLDLSEGPR